MLTGEAQIEGERARARGVWAGVDTLTTPCLPRDCVFQGLPKADP
jgi:hypothetical protein